MLYQINTEDIELKKIIKEKCGKSFSIFQRIRDNNFGSQRYKLLKISPNHKKIDLENFNDNIFLNFDLRLKGIVYYFRYKNSEYVEFCPYYKLTFQSSDNQFVIQTDCYTYSFKIYNKKKHKKFLTQLYNFKVKSHEKTLE